MPLSVLGKTENEEKDEEKIGLTGLAISFYLRSTTAKSIQKAFSLSLLGKWSNGDKKGGRKG